MQVARTMGGMYRGKQFLTTDQSSFGVDGNKSGDDVHWWHGFGDGEEEAVV